MRASASSLVEKQGNIDPDSSDPDSPGKVFYLPSRGAFVNYCRRYSYIELKVRG